jgi:AraC family transcriptional regulator
MTSNIVKHRGGLAPWQAKLVGAHIESNISRNLRVADLAGIVQLSLGHFFRSFRVSFGQPPLAYVKVRRIRHAQVLMLNTREPLSQIALDCGMYDQAHFTRVFRKVVGISPSVWRRQFRCAHQDARRGPGAGAAQDAGAEGNYGR